MKRIKRWCKDILTSEDGMHDLFVGVLFLIAIIFIIYGGLCKNWNTLKSGLWILLLAGVLRLTK